VHTAARYDLAGGFVKTISTLTLALLLSLSADAVQAAEGVLISERTVTGTTARTTQVQLEQARMRAEMSGAGGETQIIVFDGPQQVLRVINVDRKSYMEMTKADSDRMGGAMSEMQKKMADMPPAQRAKMEAMMARMGGPGGAAAKTEYRRAGSDKVGKWTCEKYEGFKNNQKVSEVCTVEPRILGLTPADFEISKQVGAFFQKLAPQGMDQMFGIGTLETQGFNGVPVRRISYAADGKVTSTSEMTDIKRQTFAAASYEVPAGFQKQTIGGR
jgi:hypothetical protein